MNLINILIERPIGAALVAIGALLSGIVSFFCLPVAPLPQVDYPTIAVTAQNPGASAETVAMSLTNPLEKYLGKIAHVTEMTSTSTQGQARIVLQFDLDRDINGAARDVQSAINAARAELPNNLPSAPAYKKLNPAETPLLILVLTSATLNQNQMYDYGVKYLQQGLSQLDGVGQIVVGGSSPPAIRVELNQNSLFAYGVSPEDVRKTLVSANAYGPKGEIRTSSQSLQILTNDQTTSVADYLDLIVSYRNGAPIYLKEIANVTYSVEDIRNDCIVNGEKAVAIYIYRQPGANVLATVARVKDQLPRLSSAIPGAIKIAIKSDRSNTIRASLKDAEWTLILAILLVFFAVYLYLGDIRATLIPSIVSMVSIITTFAAMYVLGYSLNNFTLMALIIATGFLVDDAIVVLENITRYSEKGYHEKQAVINGTTQIAFTVVSITLSLTAAFVPLLFMTGFLGRLFHEFSVTLCLAIVISLFTSLIITPVCCIVILKKHRYLGSHSRNRILIYMQKLYEISIDWCIRKRLLVFSSLLITVAANYAVFPLLQKGFFPEQDTGRLAGAIRTEQTASFQYVRGKLVEFEKIIRSDPAVESVSGIVGSAMGQTNSASVFIDLKPTSQRKDNATEVISRLRNTLTIIPGAKLFMRSVQDLFIGGRQSDAQYQYTLKGDDIADLINFAPRLLASLQNNSVITDVNSDMDDNGIASNIIIDRERASRLNISVNDIDNTLYDSFGQRQVSVIYGPINQYHVVMEVDPKYWQDPSILNDIYITALSPVNPSNGNGFTEKLSVNSGDLNDKKFNGLSVNTKKNNIKLSFPLSPESEVINQTSPDDLKKKKAIPLSAFSRLSNDTAPVAIYHQGLHAAVTLSFNLFPGKSLGDAHKEIKRIMAELKVPMTIHGNLEGTAAVFEDTLNSIPLLILISIVFVYIVLGVLYEDLLHPLTILSTLPSAGLGALLTLYVFGFEFNVITLIGLILLIGIVKKNAILMIDFAIDQQRNFRLTPSEAIRNACSMRFRPIMMTTLVAFFGAIPLVFSYGDGGEMRRPLGITMVGGLLFSQLLTLYTVPIVYIYVEKFRRYLFEYSTR
jgi:multidrug efflux pump